MPDARPPVEWMYHLGAIGTVVYAYSAFRMQLLESGRWRLRRGQLYISTHRAETDVPVLCSQFYVAGGVARNRPDARIHFAARDDMFDRGFVAGFPTGLSPRARRVRYPINAGPFLLRMRVNPVPYPTAAVLRLGRALQQVPSQTPLREVLPDELLSRFAERANEIGLSPPQRVGDVLRGAYADIQWESYGREVLASSAFEHAWRERGRRASEDIRRVIGLVREGEPVMVFPEGRPSPDGAIGPLREGIQLLVQRGRPNELVPMSIAYDPLTSGRPRAFLAVGAPTAPPERDVDEAVLALLRQTHPLTCGQVAALELGDAIEEGREEVALAALDEALEREAQVARDAGRLVDPGLLESPERARRLRGLVRYLERENLVGPVDGGVLRLNLASLAADGRLARAAIEYASAREGSVVER